MIRRNRIVAAARMKAHVGMLSALLLMNAGVARADGGWESGLRLLGTSGTVTTLASVHLDLAQ